MRIITIITSVILSLFSTIVMSYVSLATPIGPWIAPTLVFIGLLISKIMFTLTTTELAYAVSAGSIGGILATACAFSFPTLYFLDPLTFNTWMQSPLYFSSVLGGLSLLAGIFGFFIADASEKSLLETQHLSFPIGQLIHKMIAAQNQIKKAYELMIGFCTTALFCALQSAPSYLKYASIPQSFTLVHATHYGLLSIPRLTIQLGIAPMIWAIGFVTGHVIALPLAAGALSNIFVATPLQKYFFPLLSSTEFTLAFCSGIVLFITATSIVSMPHQIILSIKKNINEFNHKKINSAQFFCYDKLVMYGALAIALMLFFSHFKLPLHAQLYLVVCSIITTYQIAAIAGRIGLALLGRFATFVMVPAMLIFNLNYTHIVFIATFVEISGGVAADILFSRKLGQLSHTRHATMRTYQLLGLIISSLSIGIIFWILINHFGLGSPELFAYRAQSRQLLIQAQTFDYLVMTIGAAFGLLLKQINLNPMLVLGGLLMPFDITAGLVLGGLLALISQNKEDWYPFWSGVFASNSLCMLLKALW